MFCNAVDATSSLDAPTLASSQVEPVHSSVTLMPASKLTEVPPSAVLPSSKILASLLRELAV